MEVKKIITTDQWGQKYLRESWTFPFGSIMEAYGKRMQNTPLKTAADKKAFEKDIENVFLLSLKLTEVAFNRVDQTKVSPDVDLPVKK